MKVKLNILLLLQLSRFFLKKKIRKILSQTLCFLEQPYEFGAILHLPLDLVGEPLVMRLHFGVSEGQLLVLVLQHAHFCMQFLGFEDVFAGGDLSFGLDESDWPRRHQFLPPP